MAYAGIAAGMGLLAGLITGLFLACLRNLTWDLRNERFFDEKFGLYDGHAAGTPYEKSPQPNKAFSEDRLRENDHPEA